MANFFGLRHIAKNILWRGMQDNIIAFDMHINPPRTFPPPWQVLFIP